MKAMIFSDLITMKNAFVQTVVMMLIVGVFIMISTQSAIVGVAAISMGMSCMYFYSIAAYDEMNNWEQFRLTLPIKRHQVAYGRYASIAIVALLNFLLAIIIGFAFTGVAEMLVGSIEVPEKMLLTNTDPLYVVASGGVSLLIMLIAAAIGLPLIMRFGMTKGIRIVPVIIIMILAIGMVFVDGTPIMETVETALFNTSAVAILWTVGIVVSITLYIASAALAAKLYEGRNL
ncbi:ABC-2 transporter permease [Adlercreutzia sp. ZJ154]|uniref:ABC-2 transporter permease n=1 Tax=Adlercreutzia sp. ZJ154 TaxID=2709790 RepID=UPI0013EC1C56|nr:ABC-2 transporter permease [Adlercreutzia sp. ZJ154]